MDKGVNEGINEWFLIGKQWIQPNNDRNKNNMFEKKW